MKRELGEVLGRLSFVFSFFFEYFSQIFDVFHSRRSRIFDSISIIFNLSFDCWIR